MEASHLGSKASKISDWCNPVDLMKESRLQSALLLACSSLILVSVAAGFPFHTFQESAATPTDLAEQIKINVVRVIPQYEDTTTDDRPQVGFGIIIGEDARTLYIATPWHVVWGTDVPSKLNDKPTVVFFGSPATSKTGTRLKLALADDDLAIISVPKPSNVQPMKVARVDVKAVTKGTPVTNVGRDADWLVSYVPAFYEGQNAANPHWLQAQGLSTPPGSSGGAVVSRDGLLGMVEEDGGGVSGSSRFLAVERIAEIFKNAGYPSNLLSPEVSVARVLPSQGISDTAEANIVSCLSPLPRPSSSIEIWYLSPGTYTFALRLTQALQKARWPATFNDSGNPMSGVKGPPSGISIRTLEQSDSVLDLQKGLACARIFAHTEIDPYDVKTHPLMKGYLPPNKIDVVVASDR